MTWPFQALADETRFRVVRLISSAGVSLPAGQVAAALGVAANHLSRHLQILEAAGVTTTERKGRLHYIGVTGIGGRNDSLCAAVLSMADDTGVLTQDLARLLSMKEQEGESRDYSSESGSARFSSGSSGL